MDQVIASASGTPNLVRVIRPVVVPAQFFAWGPIAAGFLAIFPGMFTFVISNVLAGSFSLVFGPGLVAFVLAFAFILGCVAFRVFYEPSQASYAIYPDRIEFAEGLLNRRRRTVLLDRIIDVQLSEGVLQRMVGAGSVTLVTPQLVSQGDGKLSNRMFTLSNVPDPGGVYELVRSLAVGSQGAKFPLPD